MSTGTSSATYDTASELHQASRQSSTLATAYSAARDGIADSLRSFTQWLRSPTGRGVLKCTIAYTIASLATFLGPVSRFLGRPDGKHVVATITVYFHASRSAGSMIEAIAIAVVAIAYAELIGLLSMAVSVLVGSVLGLVNLAHALVVIIFIGGGFGFMGWVKQVMSNPLVNVASTLASLTIIAVVTKENAVVSNVFSNQKVVQVLKIAIMGIVSAAGTNLLLWRVSARKLFRQSMRNASTSLGEMLSLIVDEFLAGSADEASTAKLSSATKAYSVAQKQVMKNLRETKFERYVLGHLKLHTEEKICVRSMQTLALAVGGLRSAAISHLALLSRTVPKPTMQPASVSDSNAMVSRPLSPQAGSSYGVDPADTDTAEYDSAKLAGKSSVRSASDIFEVFINLVRKDMENLTHAISQLLKQSPFGTLQYHKMTNDGARDRLTDALLSFRAAKAEAAEQVYQLVALGHSRADKLQYDFEEAAAACEHFSFSLLSLGEESQKYLDVLENLQYASRHRVHSWRWMLWWRRESHTGTSASPYATSEMENLLKATKGADIVEHIEDEMIERSDDDDLRATSNTTRWKARLSRLTLNILKKMARDDIRFGIKVGIGASLWAMLAFISQTRDWYNHYRGEWGLLSFMIVCSMTVGASNTTGWSRFLGTLLGALFSVVNWNLSQGNAVILVILGFLVSYFNFWLIVARGKAPLGRMTLLAYNVSTLYAYSLSQKVEDDDDDEGGVHPIILEIVKHRAMSVTAGILWGLIICRGIWPISARKKVKEGIATLYFHMGMTWRRGPLAILLRTDCSQSYLRAGEHAAMQRYADKLDVLREAASSEFELKGPFPAATYARIMQSINRTLDGYYMMNLVTQLKQSLTPGERALLHYTAPERTLLCDRICHVFHVLAGSLMLQYPLIKTLPSVMGTRDNLLNKIFQFRSAYSARLAGNDPPPLLPISPDATSVAEYIDVVDEAGLDVTVEEKDYALLYAYALVTRQVAEELKVMEREVESLCGARAEEFLLPHQASRRGD